MLGKFSKKSAYMNHDAPLSVILSLLLNMNASVRCDVLVAQPAMYQKSSYCFVLFFNLKLEKTPQGSY